MGLFADDWDGERWLDSVHGDFVTEYPDSFYKSVSPIHKMIKDIHDRAEADIKLAGCDIFKAKKVREQLICKLNPYNDLLCKYLASVLPKYSTFRSHEDAVKYMNSVKPAGISPAAPLASKKREADGLIPVT